MENEIFKRKTIAFDKLEKFGFTRVKDEYFIERKIYGGMIARVTISLSGAVRGKVFDEDFGEPYVNHRIEGAEGAFVVGVRNAYLAFLREIAEGVARDKDYIFDQSNRINDYIEEEFGVRAEYMWKKFPHYGVYRNPTSSKWFAILMNIPKSKVIAGEEGEIEVINMKTDEMTPRYLKAGAYPSYHMNHENWITVILDDTLPDDLIKEMLLCSYRNSEKKGAGQKKKTPMES